MALDKKQQAGFSLIELMVTMFVALVLIGIGVPSFSTAMKNNRLSKNTNELLTHLMRARSEAIKRGRPVLICAANSNCNSAQWESGWVMFEDSDENGDYDSGEEIILAQQALARNKIRLAALNQSKVGFTGRGSPASSNFGHFSICDDRADAGNKINITISGRTYSNEDSSACPL